MTTLIILTYLIIGCAIAHHLERHAELWQGVRHPRATLLVIILLWLPLFIFNFKRDGDD